MRLVSLMTGKVLNCEINGTNTINSPFEGLKPVNIRIVAWVYPTTYWTCGMLMRPTLGDRELDQCVQNYILNVGREYGRRTMQGLLQANGIVVNQGRIAASLQRVASAQNNNRHLSPYQMLNPFPCWASNYGEKLYLDQNQCTGSHTLLLFMVIAGK